MDAKSIAEVGKRLLPSPKYSAVSAVEPTSVELGSSAGPLATVSPTMEAKKAWRYQEQLSQKLATDWASIQQGDPTSQSVMEYFEKRVTVRTNEPRKGLPTRFDLPEFGRSLKSLDHC